MIKFHELFRLTKVGGKEGAMGVSAYFPLITYSFTNKMFLSSFYKNIQF